MVLHAQPARPEMPRGEHASVGANPYAALPRVDDLLAAGGDLVDEHGRQAVLEAVRAELDECRAAIADGAAPPDPAAVLAGVDARLSGRPAPGPRRVINAAGVVVHTNLGRAPLSPSAVDAVVAATGYCDLEFDLVDGGRGSRGAHVDALLASAVGAEDAMVVNSCAAALVLALMALAAGREVLVSRGHMVEIGGSFRLHEVMAASGARLVEVGTTNRTRAEDYAGGDDVAALLTVHPSNFTQSGFVAQPELAAVAAVARRRGVPLLHDAGSGLLADSDHPALVDEPSMAGALAAGADLVLASGDKLLGGPQAGLIAGDAALVQRCRRHPLARAVRVDKLRLAALSTTITAHVGGRGGPVLEMLRVDDAHLDRLRARAEALADAVGGSVARQPTMVGGGSAPGRGVDSPVVRLPDAHPQALAAALRQQDPPVVGRISGDAVLLDLRTVDPRDDGHLATAVARARTAAASDASRGGGSADAGSAG